MGNYVGLLVLSVLHQNTKIIVWFTPETDNNLLKYHEILRKNIMA